ncbi:MAG: hypothetical protein QXD13_01365 [Candidatus Pacearchaeota archaeon]
MEELKLKPINVKYVTSNLEDLVRLVGKARIAKQNIFRQIGESRAEQIAIKDKEIPEKTMADIRSSYRNGKLYVMQWVAESASYK